MNSPGQQLQQLQFSPHEHCPLFLQPLQQLQFWPHWQLVALVDDDLPVKDRKKRKEIKIMNDDLVIYLKVSFRTFNQKR